MGYEEMETVAVNVATGSTGTRVNHQPGRLFKRLPATESGVASVGVLDLLSRYFSNPAGYRSNR